LRRWVEIAGFAGRVIRDSDDGEDFAELIEDEMLAVIG
jgi:hypothetical protein